MRTVIVIGEDVPEGQTTLEALSNHRSLRQGPVEINGNVLDALAWYVDAVKMTEERWAGIPD